MRQQKSSKNNFDHESEHFTCNWNQTTATRRKFAKVPRKDLLFSCDVVWTVGRFCLETSHPPWADSEKSDRIILRLWDQKVRWGNWWSLSFQNQLNEKCHWLGLSYFWTSFVVIGRMAKNQKLFNLVWRHGSCWNFVSSGWRFIAATTPSRDGLRSSLQMFLKTFFKQLNFSPNLRNRA